MKRFPGSLVVAALAVGVTLAPFAARAENVDDIFKKVDELVQKKNYAKALDELDWAKKEIEKMHLKELESFLPDTVSGMKGEQVSSNTALGFTNVERLYKKDDTTSVKISLSGGGGGAAGLGGLAAFGKMAAMMGGQNGSDTFRINGRTATLEEQKANKRADLTVFLDSGSVLKLEGENIEGSQLKTIAEALKINDLDTYLKGGNA